MAFKPKDNPLKGVKVEVPVSCENRNHFAELIIWGECGKCEKKLPVKGNESVFTRVKELV